MKNLHLAEMWDCCLMAMYDGWTGRISYVQALKKLLADKGFTREARILDAACGTGFAAIDLANDGYNITAIDGSEEMLERFRSIAETASVRLVPRQVRWGVLNGTFGPSLFDVVLCRGNSLVYANSWSTEDEKATGKEDVLGTLCAFHDVLLYDGLLYVDCAREDERPHEKLLDLSPYSGTDVYIKWRIDYFGKVRRWTAQFGDSQGIRHQVSCKSYLLAPGELVELLEMAGFNDIQRVPVEGEKNYDVYLARK